MKNKRQTTGHSDAPLDGIEELLKRFGDSPALLQKVLDTIPQAVFWKDTNLNYLGCNQLFAQHAGKQSPSDVIGLTDFDLPWGQKDAQSYRACDSRVMKCDVAEIGIIESQVNANGELTWLETNKVPFHGDNGDVIGILGTFHDITQLKRAEESLQRINEDLERRVEERTRELTFVAHHDVLTGLFNRIYFVQQLNSILESSQSEKITLLSIGIDNFKPFNKSNGHYAGDQLLSQISDILKSIMGANDMAARLGGDEFVLLLRDFQDKSQPIDICEEIRRKLDDEITISDRAKSISTSIGIVFCDTNDYQNSDDLLSDADLAMFTAKDRGKNNYCFFEKQLRQTTDLESNIPNEVLTGIQERQFVLHYQPVIDLANNNLTGFEALVRWQHPERGLVYPDQFIPIAERVGVIVQLGHQIIEMACQQLVDWKREFGELSRDVKVHVNLSPRELLQPNFVEWLVETTQSLGVEPRVLCLEITESLLLEDSDEAGRRLRLLRDEGFEVFLDDFGTGYCSLNYLDELPVDGLKIDRSFVNKLDADNSNNAIIWMILALAKKLDLCVIAEGIETELHAKTLMAMECSLMQGYFFAKPMPAEKATEILLDFSTAGSSQILPASPMIPFESSCCSIDSATQLLVE